MRRCAHILPLLGLILIAAWVFPSVAQTILPRFYTSANGISDQEIHSISQLHDGRLLIGSENGFSIWNGYKSINIDNSNNPRLRGFALWSLVDDHDTVFVSYLKQIAVFRPASSLSTFRNYKLAWIGPRLNAQFPRQATFWKDGVIIAGDNKLLFLKPYGDSYRLEDANISSGLKTESIQDTSAIYTDTRDVWVGGHHGRFCVLSSNLPKCYGVMNGLPDERVDDINQLSPGIAQIRTVNHLITLDTMTGRSTSHRLEFTPKSLANLGNFLNLSPNGQGAFVTQIAGGIASVSHNQITYERLSLELSSIFLGRSFIDRQQNLWLGTIGRGLIRAVGFQSITKYAKSTGLSGNNIWQVLPTDHDLAWVASDGGLDLLDYKNQHFLRHYDISSYALTMDHSNHLWSSTDLDTVFSIDTKTLHERSYRVSNVNQILVSKNNTIWFLTQEGIFSLNPDNLSTHDPQPEISGSAPSGIFSADNIFWVIINDRIYYRLDDGIFRKLDLPWPKQNFQPTALSMCGKNILCVGGQGGLFRIKYEKNVSRVVSIDAFEAFRSSTIYSLLTDRRHWLWAGTEHGLSVFNGTDWVTVTTADGLAANDLNQNALAEGPDGTIWAGTSNGLSHILHPDDLFHKRNLQPFIDAVQIGNTDYAGQQIPYRSAPLTFHFGTLDFRDDLGIHFQYRLDGIDNNWIDTEGSTARYPNVPSGTHRFAVRAINADKHQISTPVYFTVIMDVPMWRSIPVILLYVLMAVVVGYGIQNWRLDYILRQTHILERRVAEQTAELARQARTDSLTGLFNRGAIQEKLQELKNGIHLRKHVYIMLLDIDFFKQINDVHGHVAGDEVLVEFAHRLTGSLLAHGEYAGRYGGEEFLLVLLCAPSLIQNRIKTIRQAVTTDMFPVTGALINVTFSAGVTRLDPGEDWPTAMKRADQALYAVKHSGRNDTFFATE